MSRHLIEFGGVPVYRGQVREKKHFETISLASLTATQAWNFILTLLSYEELIKKK